MAGRAGKTAYYMAVLHGPSKGHSSLAASSPAPRGQASEVAFWAGDEEVAGGRDLGSLPPRTDEEQRGKAPETSV